jgi:hypothetical protein
MKKYISLFALVATFIAVLALFSSCGGDGTHPLVGIWENAEGTRREFFSDGTLVIPQTPDVMRTDTWSTDGNRLVWSIHAYTTVAPGVPQISSRAMSFEISGNTKTITEDSGTQNTWTRVR